MKKRSTFNLEEDVTEKLRDAVVYMQRHHPSDRVTLNGEVEDALRKKISELERRIGKPIPVRRRGLRIGRPRE